ncbi:MAG: hypothetical protein L0I76_15310 [Pseudonocardia sp.]|nr:hypothetical protein [Pseudonocardia sp.]
MAARDAGLEEFFIRYGAALAEGDLDSVADAYTYPSLVLGGPETILVTDREAVKGAFAGAAEQHRAEGFTVATPEVRVVDDGAAPGVLWVAVRWIYSSEDGSKQQLDGYRYLLRHDDGGYRIAALAPVPSNSDGDAASTPGR